MADMPAEADSMTLPAIPRPKSGDPEDVAWALSTAEAMWNRAENADAIKWIRRAAEAASEAEADDRALELAKAAAELASMVVRPDALKIAPAPHDPPGVVASHAAQSRPPAATMAGLAPYIPLPISAPPTALPVQIPASAPPHSPLAAPILHSPPPQPPRSAISMGEVAAAPVVDTPVAPTAPPPDGLPSPLAPSAPASPSWAAAPSSTAAPPPATLTATRAAGKPPSPVRAAPVQPSLPRVATRSGRRRSAHNLSDDAKRDVTSDFVAHTGGEFDVTRRPASERLLEKADDSSLEAANAPPDVVDSAHLSARPDAAMLRRTPTEGLDATDALDEDDPRTSIGTPAYTSAYTETQRRVLGGPPAELRASQAVRVVVFRTADGVHVAPAGTTVSAITVDALLVALEPDADLAAWLKG
jgi:hypothetical protein